MSEISYQLGPIPITGDNQGSLFMGSNPSSTAVFDVIASQTSKAPSEDEIADMSAYEALLHQSWVHNDLYEIRNVRPLFNSPLSVIGGVLYSGIDTLLLRGRTPWTFRNKLGKSDAAHTKRATDRICESRLVLPPHIGAEESPPIFNPLEIPCPLRNTTNMLLSVLNVLTFRIPNLLPKPAKSTLEKDEGISGREQIQIGIAALSRPQTHRIVVRMAYLIVLRTYFGSAHLSCSSKNLITEQS
ncbi:hypothetical protein BN946_scf184816.g7 [Trametes cinnabarina]|uniref:Electron transfer flavoprotein-ubiquinone oxidoreductase n=1 Tax=Pycnoporus cinnabarinus TaxID=5643 RepID=A0A060SQA0_PYCCI|nr:hypothetical protein BN946_scf184816.g7 [Trametes cinnabarina]